jgi:hypothetical protein
VRRPVRTTKRDVCLGGGPADGAPTLTGLVAPLTYRYELRQGDQIVATGRFGQEQPLQPGDRVEIGGRSGIVHTVAPLLGESELHLVVQLLRQQGD